jgi:hypothetical protein
MSEDQANQREKQERAVAALLARVPTGEPPPPSATQWVESDRNKTDPHGLY